jgi:hypothetical protein
MADEPREFLIRVERPWKLWILPGIAILYFVLILAMAILRIEFRSVSTDALVYAGAVLFVVVILIELPFFLRRRVRVEEPEPSPYAPESAAAGPLVGAGDHEALATSESQQGLRVLEFSAPPKSQNRGSVYAKTYVPVTKEHVLRVETLAAEPSEL